MLEFCSDYAVYGMADCVQCDYCFKGKLPCSSMQAMSSHKLQKQSGGDSNWLHVCL